MPTNLGYRDDVALEAVQAALEACGLFDAVLIDSTPQTQSVGNYRCVAWLRRASWDEVQDASPDCDTHTLNFVLTISVRDADPGTRFRRLCQAEDAAHNAIDNQPIGGFTMLARNRLFRGVDDATATEPERRVNCSGRLQYMLPDSGSHDTTDRT